MSGIPWRSIAMRSGPMPHAKPVYFSLSTLQFSSTAGCTMPEPRISIQPVCLQAAQPEPPQIWHCTSISADGSVNGKYDGRNRTFVAGEKMRRANVASVALKSTNVMPSSTARSEEHTSELQSLAYLVCRLLLEKKKKNKYNYTRVTSSN